MKSTLFCFAHNEIRISNLGNLYGSNAIVMESDVEIYGIHTILTLR